MREREGFADAGDWCCVLNLGKEPVRCVRIARMKSDSTPHHPPPTNPPPYTLPPLRVYRTLRLYLPTTSLLD